MKKQKDLMQAGLKAQFKRSTHTLRPWIAHDGVGIVDITDADGKQIARAIGGADAHLIAAAPQMFQALLDMTAEHKRNTCMCSGCQAIAKVEGR